jgi:cell division protein FtsI (penicillin-binding protein 3)
MIRTSRIGVAHLMLALFALAILARSAQLQLVDGAKWRARAARQQSRDRTVPAPRGEILDATHRVLAESREMVRLEIAPREVNQPAKLRRTLAALKVDRASIAKALDQKLKWVTIPGAYLSLDAAAVMGLRGVYATAAITRAYAVSTGMQGIIGHVGVDNKPVDGVELSLDSILRGTPGSATLLVDSRGQRRESPTVPGIPPTKGNTIVLTLNNDLQQIAENALGDAVARMGAEGGDIVILDPHSGEILALASRRSDPRQTSATTITEPFEPGSTMKPFMAAGLLERGRVRDSDTVDTGAGILELNGRTIRDEHKLGRAPLADVLRWSSNIGIVRFSQRLNAREQFETLRDFGFGTATGVPYPTESGGTLRAPTHWSVQSPASLAMGYEIAATPLQLALAYATFANGGELVEPALVKEIRSADGEVRYRHRRRVVRRVMADSIAGKIRHMLLDVVDEGTALQAALSNYMLAGKTGTPRGMLRGHYIAGRYNPNFVGIFPGDSPQFVIVVKLTAPQGTFYGGTTAAPLTRAILETAVAARDAALDRTKLASSIIHRPDTTTPIIQAGGQVDSADSSVTEPLVPTPVAADSTPSRARNEPYVATLPPARPLPQPAEPTRLVPIVRGLSLRDAVRSLHKAGFRVQLARGGFGPTAGSTSPAGGELAPSGTLVRLLYDH